MNLLTELRNEAVRLLREEFLPLHLRNPRQVQQLRNVLHSHLCVTVGRGAKTHIDMAWRCFQPHLERLIEVASHQKSAAQEVHEQPESMKVKLSKRRGPKVRNDVVRQFAAELRKKDSRIAIKTIIVQFRKEWPQHPIFESEDPYSAFRSALRG